MKKGYAISLAVVGVAACLAVFALKTQAPEAVNLKTYTHEFDKFVSKHGKSYGTKAEY